MGWKGEQREELVLVVLVVSFPCPNWGRIEASQGLCAQRDLWSSTCYNGSWTPGIEGLVEKLIKKIPESGLVGKACNSSYLRDTFKVHD